jgi:hypothetical protein
MKTLTTFLSVLMPQLAPILPRVPELVNLIRGAFTRVGGKDADLDKILAANQIDIDRLADPDSFRNKGPRRN